MNQKIRKACVIGWPIAQSRSPRIHQFWLRVNALEGTYEAVEKSIPDFPSFLKSLDKQGFIGANITLPHKETAFQLISNLESTAKAIGAVNTVWYENNKLYGANSDVFGFLQNLDSNAQGWDDNPKCALILGAGGAARAIVHACHQRGFEKIIVSNRTREKSDILKSISPRVMSVSFPPSIQDLKSADILINATSLGMYGQQPLLIDIKGLKPTAVVCETIYNPLKTDLILQAEKAGHRTVDGLGMLLHQAVYGFEKWFGKKPVVTQELYNLISSDIPKTMAEIKKS